MGGVKSTIFKESNNKYDNSLDAAQKHCRAPVRRIFTCTYNATRINDNILLPINTPPVSTFHHTSMVWPSATVAIACVAITDVLISAVLAELATGIPF